MKKPPIDIYQDRAGKWRWRIHGKNGEILAQSSQGDAYTRRVDAWDGLYATQQVLDAAEWPTRAAPKKPAR